MQETWLLYGGGLVLVLLILWGLQRRRTAESYADVAQQMIQASNIALDAVQAAEQLWRTGALPKDDRFDYVFDELAELFPDLTERQLRMTIESAVYWLKYGVENIGELKVDSTELPPFREWLGESAQESTREVP